LQVGCGVYTSLLLVFYKRLFAACFNVCRVFCKVNKDKQARKQLSGNVLWSLIQMKKAIISLLFIILIICSSVLTANLIMVNA
jgi:hypothetical protein